MDSFSLSALPLSSRMDRLLALADSAHLRTVLSGVRPWAVNALVLGRDRNNRVVKAAAPAEGGADGDREGEGGGGVEVVPAGVHALLKVVWVTWVMWMLCPLIALPSA